ncbi:MAG: hypothetical protein JWO80_2637 [Bryobacterales bacterium]|nr:hypothetical protein [Bryobacterales bacterium]
MLSLHNPAGFGAADLIEFAVAALLVALVLGWSRTAPAFRKLAARPGWCMVVCGVLPVAMRLAMLPRFPVPTPAGADDFAYLLLGDTLAHFRFANAVHPMHRFFEAVFVLQEPSYSSIYPVGQGIVLALGQVVFGHPWAGVVASVGVFCALCYWMLRGWVSAEWALAGGLLAVCEFGPLNQWMNIYWGGAVSAAAGCLVFGALPRLRERGSARDGVVLGLGLAGELLTRPFEFLVVVGAVGLWWVSDRPRKTMACPTAFGDGVGAGDGLGGGDGVGAGVGVSGGVGLGGGNGVGAGVGVSGGVGLGGVVVVIVLAAVGITSLQNRQVTGSWTTLPYQLSRSEYGVPATFTFQPNPVPHRALTAEQRLDYDAQCAIHDTPGSYLQRLWDRVRFYRFFFLAPLYLALPAFAWKLSELRFAWVLATVVLFALGTNFYPYFYPHYVAAEACLFVLISVVALERMPPPAARIILLLCGAHFLFWYGARAIASEPDMDGRASVNERLAKSPGKQLVFVRYAPGHMFHEWIHNAADIDAARVVWAADLGSAENDKLRRYYPDRTVWLVEPDARPATIRRD